MMTRWRHLRCGAAGWICLLASSGLGFPSALRAFSEPSSYADPTPEGGGGGRWFTGSVADRYTCDVCHGSAPLDLAVEAYFPHVEIVVFSNIRPPH
ncbi:MAG: hypothetical protein V3V08_13385 [Nannocystaceae bacterium]